MQKMVTAKAAADEIGVSIDTIRRWEKKGLIKSTRDARNYRLFSLDEIKRLQRKLSGKSSANKYKIYKVKKASGYTSIDLFAGAGGTALGLENAGFRHVFLNEFDKNAAATLRQNRPRWNVSDDDIHNVDFRKFAGKVDLVEGGFPCQSFSYAGRKRGFKDARGTLFYEFARAVKEIRPKVAMGENVRGLLKHDGGKTLATMLKILQDLGYDVAYKLMRSQYLDVPQKRERLVILAARRDLNLPILFPKEKDYTISLREAIADVPEGDGQIYSPYKAKIMAMVPEGGYWRDLPDDVRRDYMKASYYQGGGKTG
ncbi:MAG: DNA (cytosine-5-)-methyltransferase, partial [Candidatus Nomurabacteria bacterium]|nr:DNA (cytosine-5-)-methyltransferase [Candidatus Nomurabacteria bacterium]